MDVVVVVMVAHHVVCLGCVCYKWEGGAVVLAQHLDHVFGAAAAATLQLTAFLLLSKPGVGWGLCCVSRTGLCRSCPKGPSG